MRVAFWNEAAEASGAEISLLQLLQGVKQHQVEPLAVLVQGSPLVPRIRQEAIPMVQIPSASAGFTANPFNLFRIFQQLHSQAQQLSKILREWNVDLIHANSIRAGLVAALIPPRSRPPLLVHIRDCLPRTLQASLARHFICSRAEGIVANSYHTLHRFLTKTRRSRYTGVVYNSISVDQFDPGQHQDRKWRTHWNVEEGSVLLGVVGQITPWKGQIDAIEALSLIRRNFPKTKLVLVGSVKFAHAGARYDNAAYQRELEVKVENSGLGDHVIFAGEHQDIPAVMAALDILLLPSWEEPFGRVLIEAMAMEKPVVATDRGGPREIVVDGKWRMENRKWRMENGETKGERGTENRTADVHSPFSIFHSPSEEPTGLLVPPQDPKALAEAVNWLLEHPEEARAMGQAGRRRVLQHFDQRQVAAWIVEIYREVLAERGRWP